MVIMMISMSVLFDSPQHVEQCTATATATATAYKCFTKDFICIEQVTVEK